MADDGNFLKVVAVAEEKVCIAPLLAAFPSSKIFQQDEKLNRSGADDLFHELGLHSIEFGFFQLATDAKTRSRSSCCSRLALIDVFGFWFWSLRKGRVLGLGDDEHSDNG